MHRGWRIWGTKSHLHHWNNSHRSFWVMWATGRLIFLQQHLITEVHPKAQPHSPPPLHPSSPRPAPSASWYSGQFHEERSVSQKDTRQKRLPWIFLPSKGGRSTIFRKGDIFGKTYPQMKTSISFTNPAWQISSQEVIGYNGGNSWEMSDATVRVEQPERRGIKYEAFVLFLFHSLSQQLRLSIYIMLPSSNGLVKWSSAFLGGGGCRKCSQWLGERAVSCESKVELKLVLGPLESFWSHKGAFKPSIQVKLWNHPKKRCFQKFTQQLQ